MIQITDLTNLQDIRDRMASLIVSQQNNWNDDVYGRIVSTRLNPILSQCDTTISDVSSGIRQIVVIFQEMELLASTY